MKLVSIHAPARGATLLRTRAGTFYCSFNPRPRAGGDEIPRHSNCALSVSIHAPARGATSVSCSMLPVTTVSIHAPARGATARRRQDDPCIRFQSTPPRGGRPRREGCIAPDHGFNPRPRAGGDVWGRCGDPDHRVSIHAPARGATTLLGK